MAAPGGPAVYAMHLDTRDPPGAPACRCQRERFAGGAGSGALFQHVRDTDRGDRPVEPALQGRKVAACVDARFIVLVWTELSAREHPTQRGARRSQATLQQSLLDALLDPLLDARVDELLPRLGVLFEKDFEDVLPPRLDLRILDRAEPSEQLLARLDRHW